MKPTRKQIEDWLREHTDKMLTFGCLLWNESEGCYGKVCGVSPNSLQVWVKWDNCYEPSPFLVCNSDWIKGHDLKIGDVLAEKLKRLEEATYPNNTLSYNDKRGNQVISGKIQPIIDAWGKCGFTKSLQQIIAESGWEEVLEECKAHGQGENPEDCCCENVEVLKDDNASNLFSFISNLNL